MGDKWSEGSQLQTYPEAVRAVLAEAPELAHLAGAWEDYVGEGGHSLSAMQALTLALALTLISLTLTLTLTLTTRSLRYRP